MRRRSLAELAFHDDGAAAINGGQPQAGPLAAPLGSKEGFEDVIQRLLIDAGARVAHRQRHVWTGIHRGVGPRKGFCERHIGGFNGELAALRHGIPGVDGQVHDDLFHLSWVGLHAPQGCLEQRYPLDVLTDQAPQHLVHVGHDRVEVDDLGLQNLLSAQCQKLLSKGCGAVGGRLDGFDARPQGIRLADAGENQLAVAPNHGQQIVEIVGHAACQSSYDPHLLRLSGLVLDPADLDLGLAGTLVAEKGLIHAFH